MIERNGRRGWPFDSCSKRGVDCAPLDKLNILGV